MVADKRIEETLKVLNLKVFEQGIEKIAGAFDEYTAKMGQELAFMNQRITNIECRLDNLEKLVSSSSIRKEAALQIPLETGASSEIASSESLTPPPLPRQTVKRRLEPASFVPEEISKVRKHPREGFRGYIPVRGSIKEEKHVRASVFARELNKRQEVAFVAAPGERTVTISHSVRRDTSANEPINISGNTSEVTALKNRKDIEEWLRRTEVCFNDLDFKTQEEVMLNYTQLKAFLCKDKKEKDYTCMVCLIKDTIDCPLYKF